MQWADRDRFPDSVSFSYYYIYSSLAVKKSISPEEKQRIIRFLRDCQVDGGGFKSTPSAMTPADSMNTYMALESFRLLNIPFPFPKEGVIVFIRSLEAPGGGMKFLASDTSGSVQGTYWSLLALGSLGLDKELYPGNLKGGKLVRFLREFKVKGSGFSTFRGKPASLRATVMALTCLDVARKLDRATMEDVKNYLLASRYSGLVKDRKYPTYPYTELMHWALVGFGRLNIMDQLDLGAVNAFLDARFIPSNGGFGPRPGLGSTPPSTYHALRSLSILGRIPDPAPGSLY